MASGSGGSGSGGVSLAGKKRKASGGLGSREPKRGLGVAALENIRTRLETAEHFYMLPPRQPLAAATPPSLSPPPPPPPPPPSSFVGHVPGVHAPPPPSSLAGHVPAVRYDPYAGNAAAQRDYYPQYYGAQHYSSDVLARMLAPRGHAVPRLSHHQANQNVAAITPALPLEQAHQNVVVAATPPFQEHQVHQNVFIARTPPLLEQDHRRRPQAQQPLQHQGQMRGSQIAFVDLVDSDDDEEELDLELRL